jgi:hypothetical protein
MKLKVVVVDKKGGGKRLVVEGRIPKKLRILINMKPNTYTSFEGSYAYRNSEFEWTIGFVMYSLYHLVEIANNERW